MQLILICFLFWAQLWFTRKYQLCGYILGVLTHTTPRTDLTAGKWWNSNLFLVFLEIYLTTLFWKTYCFSDFTGGWRRERRTNRHFSGIIFFLLLIKVRHLQIFFTCSGFKYAQTNEFLICYYVAKSCGNTILNMCVISNYTKWMLILIHKC